MNAPPTKTPTKAPPEAIPLSALDPGQGARVISIAGEARDRQRILEIGLIPDAEVQVTRTAPFGDPIEIELRGASFSI
ncbi:MAG: ferrous iron transport protein A, partial [Deltaproteobacteria bacterium]|nr:ferrous iron transport protein A [Deltaproteobacteria bacterium]